MVRISKDIRELLDQDQKVVKTSKFVYKLVVFLALVGIVAIVAGIVESCRDKPVSESIVKEVVK